MIDKKESFLFYKKYTDVFLETTEKIVNVFNTFTPTVKITENFSNVLLKIYQCYMDVFSSCTILVEKQNFFSFSILCRSVLDVTVQLMWILDIKSPEERQKAIEFFLNFNGVGEYTDKNGTKKKTHRWQDIIIQKHFDYDQVIKRLGLDSENKHLTSTFDYLSKVIHWNPKIINELVGFTEGHLVFGSEQLKMFFIASSEFISCSIRFIIIFSEHFYSDRHKECSEKALKIQKDFFMCYRKLAKLDEIE